VRWPSKGPRVTGGEGLGARSRGYVRPDDSAIRRYHFLHPVWGGCVRAPWVRRAPSTAALLPPILCPESAVGAPLTAGVVSMLGSVDDRVTSPADVRPMTVRRRVAVAGHPPDEHLVRPPRVPVWALLGSLLNQRTEHAFEDRSVYLQIATGS